MLLRRSGRGTKAAVLLASAAERPLSQPVRHALEGATSAETRDLLVAASRHGVTGFVTSTVLALPGLAPEVRTALEGAGNRVLRDHLRAVTELATIAAAMDDLPAPWSVLKGPALGQTSYPVPHLREYVDLDLLVPPSGLRAALEQLTDAGCRLIDRPWTDLHRERAGEVRLVSSGGVPIDLHWHLMDDWRVRDAFHLPPVERLLEGSVPVRLGAVDVQTLGPVDMALHVALHACTSGGWRLSWLKDVTQALQRTHGQEDALRERARSWNVELVLGAMADRARRTLGAPGPTFAPRAGAAWLRLLAVVDAVAPVERATGAGSVTRIVTNSTRRTTASSVSELARRTFAFTTAHAAARPSGTGLR